MNKNNITKPEFILLNQHALDNLTIDYNQVLSIVENCYISLLGGNSFNPPKSIIDFDNKFIGYSMIGRDASTETTGFKLVYEHDPSRKNGDYNFCSSIIIFDDASGFPLAIVDVLKLGPLRTSATSALFAKAACPDAKTALVVGTGVQGQMALPMLLAALPNLERLIVFGTYQNGIEMIRKNVSCLYPDRDIEVSGNLGRSASEADVILGVSGLSCREQVHLCDMKKGSIAILVGYGVDADVLHGADYLVTTDIEQMKVTSGDLADTQGNIPPFHAVLPEILAGKAPVRMASQDIVFAYNSGMVVTDVALARHFYTQAVNVGIGGVVPLWN